MDVRYLQEHLEIFAYNGVGLSKDETLLCESSMYRLVSNEKLPNLYFWGTIYGTKHDYFICFGYIGDCLAEKQFYISTDLQEWNRLPERQDKYKELSLLCKEPFTGNLSCTTQVQMLPTFLTNNDGKMTQEDQEFVTLPEGARLAWIVHLITEESAIVPRGSFYRHFDGKITENKLFTGIDSFEINNWKNYQLWRQPRSFSKDNPNYSIDFLDSIDDVMPKGRAFSLQFEKAGRFVLIRSLVWLGMTFFYDQLSKNHSFLYFGYGEKNTNILFMLNFE